MPRWGNLSVLLVVLALVVSACGGVSTPTVVQEKPVLKVSISLRVVVPRLKSYEAVRMELVVPESQWKDRYYGDMRGYFLTGDNLARVKGFLGEVDKQKAAFGRNMKEFFGLSGMLANEAYEVFEQRCLQVDGKSCFDPEKNYMWAVSTGDKNSRPLESVSFVLPLHMKEEVTSTWDYKTSFRTDGQKAYFSVRSKNESEVKWTFPYVLIQGALDEFLNGRVGPIKVTPSRFTRTDLVSSKADQERALLENLFGARERGVEAVSFSFAAGARGLEDRDQMMLFLARGLEVSASVFKQPVRVVVFGSLSNGGFGTTEVSASSGRMYAYSGLFSSSVSFSGATTSISTNFAVSDFLNGSIYVISQ